MKINKFKKIGINKYKLYFDNNTLILYEDVILKYNLLYKKEIDNDLLIEINKYNYKCSINDVAIKYIGIKMRSIKEMKEYLLKKKYDIKDINESIEELINKGLLNDISFCKSYINDKINLTNNGINKIKDDLIKLGIGEDVIDKELSNIDNSFIMDKLNKIINKEIKLSSKLPIIKLKNKVINKCINLGYKYEDILEIINNIDINSMSNIKKDYDKVYNKYKDKYDKDKLDNTIKQKLYQKGYSMDEINNLIN